MQCSLASKRAVLVNVRAVGVHHSPCPGQGFKVKPLGHPIARASKSKYDDMTIEELQADIEESIEFGTRVKYFTDRAQIGLPALLLLALVVSNIMHAMR